MGPWMSLVRPWTGPTGCSRFGRSKRPQQVHVLFAQQKEVLAQRPVTRKKSRHIHSTKRICLGSRPLSSCLHRYEMWWNMMKCDDIQHNSTKLQVISAKKSAMIFHATFSELCTLKQGASSSSQLSTTDSTSSTCEPLSTTVCNEFYILWFMMIYHESMNHESVSSTHWSTSWSKASPTT